MITTALRMCYLDVIMSLYILTLYCVVSSETKPTVAVRGKAQARAVSAPRPRLMSRGAAARARAEAAWDARARAEATERAMSVSSDCPRAVSAERSRTYQSAVGRR